MVNYTKFSGSVGQRVDASSSRSKPNNTLVLFILHGVIKPRINIKPDVIVEEDSEYNSIKVGIVGAIGKTFAV